jgi:osmotically-inducible protein OsmY
MPTTAAKSGTTVTTVMTPARQDILATADAQIARQIERTVIGLLPDLDARCFRVKVDDGQVFRVGRVPWHRDVDACSRVATAVPGVTVVVNRLDYVWDDRPRGRWSVHHHG